jgi:DnaK suppressor protein
MKDTVTKSARKAGSQAAPAASRKTGVVKAVASALARKIADVLAPAKPARAAPKAAAQSATKAAAKPATKVAARPAPKPAAKAVKTAAKPAAAKAAATAAPAKAAPVKAAKATPKALSGAAASPASRAATKSAKAVAATAARPAVKAQHTPAPQARQASTKKTAQQQAVKASDTGARTDAVAGATAELADKMKTSVVSKVSEVMTKTTKSTPALHTEGRIISEDEIRAMGEKDYMNPAQLAFFKARLQQLEKDLLKNAGETTEHLRETVLVPDPADRATIEEEHALELRTRDRERKLLKKVQQSIAAIDAGDYGWCEETGEPIGIPRLIARPTATLSLEAQQRRELKQKLYGD